MWLFPPTQCPLLEESMAQASPTLLIKDATPPPPFLSMPLFPSPLAGDSSTQVRDQDTGTIKAKGSELCLKHGIQARHPVYPLSPLKLSTHSNHIALSSGLDT